MTERHSHLMDEYIVCVCGHSFYRIPIWLTISFISPYNDTKKRYFRGVDGKLLKKSKHNLVSARIEEAFSQKSLGADIIAYYIYIPNGTEVCRRGLLCLLPRVLVND